MSSVPLRTRYAALRTLLWQRYGLIPRVSTLDLDNWQLCAVSPDAATVPADEVSVCIGPSISDAVDAMLDALAHDDAAPLLHTSDGPATLADLCAAYPHGFTRDAPGDDVAPERPLPHAMGGA